MIRIHNFHRLCVLLMLVLVAGGMSASPVSETAARQKAQAFLKERRPLSLVSLHAAPVRPGVRRSAKGVVSAAPYYLFNIGSGDGFVLVSGDDRTPAILGYADSGSLSEDNMPDGLRYLLDGYAQQMEWLGTQPEQPAQSPRKAAARTSIAPLIKTHWDQGAPYNMYCPIKTDGKQTATGCVATCMAQIMYYHQWPAAEVPTIPGYTTRDNLFTLDALLPTTFSWSDMQLTYGGSSTDTQKEAVAKLMQYCGHALQMKYNTSSSAFSESIAESLRLYFGYSNGIDYVKRNAYSYIEWIDLLYGELAAKRPVALGGQAVGSGHSFICDGYQGDDYFHINWGWGGTSDGYFRLTALNPEEQGIGGASTLDGFSFGQDAVIGIKPATSGEAAAATRLTLVGLQFESANATTTKTVTRSSTDVDFANIPLRFTMGCMTPGTNNFTVGAQVTDAGGNTKQVVTIESDNLTFPYYYNFTASTALGKDLADGTYNIYIVSRMGDAQEWQYSYGSKKLHYTAVIAGNTLKLSTPLLIEGDSPTLVSLTTDPENPTLGDEVSVTATLTGGNSDYRSDLLLCVDGSVVMGKQADIPAGETVSVHFTYTPSKAGNNKLTVCDAYEKQLGEAKTISVTDDGSTMALTLGLSATVSNTYEEKGVTYYYGNGIRATITVTNSSKEHDYRGTVNCSVRTWDGDNYVGNATSYAVTVPKNGSKEIPVVVDGLAAGGTYNLRITYYTVEDGKKKLAANEVHTDKLVMGEGYALYNADGTTTLHRAASSISTGDAYFVDMTAMKNTGSISVTPSTNLNCIYRLQAGADTPQGLSGKNVVKGTVAETITLTDGHDFCSPLDFTAASVRYTRTFTRAATSTGGWNGLYVPFDVEEVTCDGNKIDWFRSDSDTGKNFWLKTMTGDDGGTLYFDHADALKANTPYIIALPGEDFGQWKLTGKAVTFSGSNALIAATATGSLSGNSYKICGSTVRQSHTDSYMLNTAGSRFVKGTATLPPFRAWIEAASISSLSRQQLAICDGELQGIEDIESGKANIEGATAAWYTLDGRRVSSKAVSRKGLYIRNGKKIIVR